MHLPDGIIKEGVIVASYILNLILYYLLAINRRINFKLVPKLSLITAVLFVASLFYIPVGMTTVHFSFIGLAGILLGPLSFLSVVVALLLQLILFNHGGYSTFGVNSLNYILGALSAYYIFKFRKKFELTYITEGFFAFIAGAIAVMVAVLFTSIALYLSDYPASVVISLFTVHLPIFILEGILTALVVIALRKKERSYIYEQKQ